MRIDLIIKPASLDHVEKLRADVARLRERRHEVYAHLTFEAGDAVRFARSAAEAASDVIIAAGGDGTLNEVANGVHEHLEASAQRGAAPAKPPAQGPRIAVVPLGTANDLANTLSIPSDTSEAIELALHGRAKLIDVPRVNGRCFLNVSTGGFGADATAEASDGAKGALGTFAYLISAVKKFVRLEPTPARFHARELLYEGRFLLFAVGNLRQTGGGQLLTPEASAADGLLDVCIVNDLPRAKFLSLLPGLHSGHHLDHDAVVYHRVRALRIEAEESITVNADGEPLEGRTFEYEISPHRLLLVGAHKEVAGAAA